MNSFKKTTHNFGEIAPSTFNNKKQLTVTFDSRYPIVSATGDCGCTNLTINNTQLVVKWDVPFLPSNLSVYNVKRTINAVVKKGEEHFPETLTVEAILKR